MYSEHECNVYRRVLAGARGAARHPRVLRVAAGAQVHERVPDVRERHERAHPTRVLLAQPVPLPTHLGAQGTPPRITSPHTTCHITLLHFTSIAA